jgi:DNA repair photolyase
MDILPDLPSGKPLKGRGAVSNPTGRFERERRHRVDDGWTSARTGFKPASAPNEAAYDATNNAVDHEAVQNETRFNAAVTAPPQEETRPRTRILVDATRAILTRNSSPDSPFDRSINPYRGCEHGCVYCFARPTHAYLGLSPGLDFETRILAKPNAPKLLAKELSRKSYRCRPIAMGTNTDPYQPIERRLRTTRGILEVLSAFNHPLTIVTKSDAVLTDLDILAPMAQRGLVKVCLSVTTLDPTLARKLEPRAATPQRRLAALRALDAAGVPTGIMVSPVIPALTDTEMEAILKTAAAMGVREAGYILLRLPLEVKDLFTEWLHAHYPDRARHVLSLIRDTRAGGLNDASFGRRMSGQGPYAALIKARFANATRRFGLNQESHAGLDCSNFAAPVKAGEQLALF